MANMNVRKAAIGRVSGAKIDLIDSWNCPQFTVLIGSFEMHFTQIPSVGLL